MEISHIEHIGIAVPNLEEAIKYYENVLGLKCYKQEVVEDQKVTTAFFKVGDTKIELLEATSPDSTIAKFIEKNGGRGRTPQRQGSAQGRRRPEHRFPPPQEHGSRAY